MGFLQDNSGNYLIPIHSDNATNQDWVVMLEAGTIVGPSPERVRVAGTFHEKKVIKKYDLFRRAKYFIVVEGYNPRIHSLYFCPQLYRFNSEKKLVPLQGEEIGRLIAQAVAANVVERRPWYEPSEKLPNRPVINTATLNEFDSVVVELPNGRNPSATEPQLLLARENRHADGS